MTPPDRTDEIAGSRHAARRRRHDRLLLREAARLLDLAWTDDAERLSEQLDKAVAADELVLDLTFPRFGGSPTAAAYLRLASRFDALWGDRTRPRKVRRAMTTGLVIAKVP
jgi:hypothetical protein